MRNEDLERQISVLKNNFAKTKSKERNLSIEKSILMEHDRKREAEEVSQLKEADTVISDMTDLLRKRENEINMLVGENKQIMMRYVQLESICAHVS